MWWLNNSPCEISNASKTISPREFLDQSWQNQDKNFASPYLTENIDKFNEVLRSLLYFPFILTYIRYLSSGELLGVYGNLV